MLVSTINSFNTYKNYYNNKQDIQRPSIKTLKCDSFQRSNMISFGQYVPSPFERLLPLEFFEKLAQEGIPCAYTGASLISKHDYEWLEGLASLRHPLQISIEYLNNYSLPEFPQKVLSKVISIMRKQQDKTSPPKSLLDIFKEERPKAEIRLRKKQLELLSKILIASRDLPEADYKIFKETIFSYMDKLTKQEVYGINLRPKLIYAKFCMTNCQDTKLKKVIKGLIEKIPTDKNSTDAYIVSHTMETNLPGGNNRIALDILKQSLYSYEHFYPKKLYKAENQWNKFIILTTPDINHLKKDLTPDKFIRRYDRKYNIKDNMQAQVNRFIEIYDKWKCTDPENADRLLKYILAYKYEVENRSKHVKIDIDDFLTKVKSTKDDMSKFEDANSQIRRLFKIKSDSL